MTPQEFCERIAPHLPIGPYTTDWGDDAESALQDEEGVNHAARLLLGAVVADYCHSFRTETDGPTGRMRVSVAVGIEHPWEHIDIADPSPYSILFAALEAIKRQKEKDQ